jgi:hypothetical protein
MTIQVREDAERGLTIVNGHMRLRATLALDGQATVYNMTTGKAMQVHDVDGQLVALTLESQQLLKDATQSVIDAMKQKK